MLGAKDQFLPDKPYEPFVTVVIPAYNEAECIADTILGIQKQTYPIREIIVVDDCSSDGTGGIARSLGATVHRPMQNSGTKSRAVNFVVPGIKTSVFIVIDADTVLRENAVELLIPHLADGKTLSACGFVIPQVRKSFWERARTIEYLYGLGLFKSAQEHLSLPLVSSGCLSAFNRKLFVEIGMFPEGNIAEDMALTWKAHILGYKVKYESKSICYPKEPHDFAQYKRQVLRWYRGYFQCLAQYKFQILKNKRLALLVAYYTLSGMIAPFWLVLLGFSAYDIFMNGLSPVTTLVLIGFSFEFILGYCTVIIKGRQVGLLKNALRDYLMLFAVSPINAVLYIYSFVQELILKNKLSIWEKGH
jgi:biofilm PGA synthesis N-glycosyltransferase PgaC